MLLIFLTNKLPRVTVYAMMMYIKPAKTILSRPCSQGVKYHRNTHEKQISRVGQKVSVKIDHFMNQKSENKQVAFTDSCSCSCGSYRWKLYCWLAFGWIEDLLWWVKVAFTITMWWWGTTCFCFFCYRHARDHVFFPIFGQDGSMAVLWIDRLGFVRSCKQLFESQWQRYQKGL